MLHASLSGEPPLKDLLFALALAAIQVCETHRASWIKTILTHAPAYGPVGLASVWRTGAGLTIGRDLQDFHPAAYELV